MINTPRDFSGEIGRDLEVLRDPRAWQAEASTRAGTVTGSGRRDVNKASSMLWVKHIFWLGSCHLLFIWSAHSQRRRLCALHTEKLRLG